MKKDNQSKTPRQKAHDLMNRVGYMLTESEMDEMEHIFDGANIERVHELNREVARLREKEDSIAKNFLEIFSDKICKKHSGENTPPIGEFLRMSNCGTCLKIARKQNKLMREALEHIAEYWNGSSNERAMSDACDHNVDTALEALSKVKEMDQ